VATTAPAAQARMHEILDSAPARRRHYVLWGLSAGGTLLDGMSIASIAIALPLIKLTFTMSPLMIGAVSAASVVGMAVGAISGGRASDHIGRRRLFVLSMAAISLTAAGSAFAWAPWVICISQFLLGCGIGSEFPNSSAYVSEIMPKSVRNRMLVATITAQSVGMLIGMSLAFLLLREDPEIDTWRYFLASRAVVAVAFFFLRRVVMPESPVWLMSHGRNAEAAKTIASLAPDDEKELTELSAQAGDQRLGAGENESGAPRGFAVLFSRKYIRRTALTAGAWFLMDISTYGVGQFAPTVLAKISSGQKSGGTIAAEFASIEGSLAIDSFLLFGFLLAMWLVPRVGEIKMQAIGFLGMVAGMGILFFATGSSTAAGASGLLVIVGFSVFNLLMNMGPNSTTFGLAALLFPPEVRATAAGFSAMCAKIGATGGTLLLPSISEAIGLHYTLALLAGLSGLAFLVTVTLGRGLETRGGGHAGSAGMG
jgi:putative MFS transporter